MARTPVLALALLLATLLAGCLEAGAGTQTQTSTSNTPDAPPCGEGESEGCVPACPTGLSGYATEQGGVFLSWTLRSPTDVNVYRAEGDGPFVLVDRLVFPATRHIDDAVEKGVTYRYQVTAVADFESEPCGTFEVTTIPEFPTLVAGALAVALGAFAYAALRRRS